MSDIPTVKDEMNAKISPFTYSLCERSDFSLAAEHPNAIFCLI